MIKAVIFDIDNTLLDFMKMKSDSISSAIDGMISVGMNIDKDKSSKEIYDIYETKGYEHQEVFNEFIISKTGNINYKFLAAAIVEYKKTKELSLDVYNDVIPTLEKLNAMNLKLGIVSDAPSREAWIRLYTLNLHDKFQQVVTFNDTGFHKPAKEPFLKISEKLDTPLNECIMIGDWPDRDIKGAKEVGMKTAFAKYGSTQDINDSGADYDLNSVSELIDIINYINN
jgi:putative hydrolase of the HAD superfamily